MAEDLNTIGYHPDPPTWLIPRRVFRGPGVPTSTGQLEGDLYFADNGTAYEFISGAWVQQWTAGGGGGAAQTPWAQDIDAAGFDLTDVGSLGIGTATPATAIELANGTADQAFLITRPNATSFSSLGFRTGATYQWQLGQRSGDNDVHIFNAQNSSEVKIGYAGDLTVFNSVGAGFVDNSINLLNLSSGYSALAAWFPADGTVGTSRALAIGAGPAGATVYGNRGYIGLNPAGGVGEPPDLVISQEEDGAGGYLPHIRQLFTGSSGDIDFYSYNTAVTTGTQSLHINGATGNVAIGTVTPLGLFTLNQLTANAAVLTSAGYSLTGANAQSLIDLAGTWNTSGTPIAFKLNITNTASNAASLLADFQAGGVSQFKLAVGGIATFSNDIITTGDLSVRPASANIRISSGGISFATDTVLVRDAANTLALRNSTNAQAFNVYNTFTDASNYERGAIAWSSNRLTFGPNAAGSGTSGRALVLGSTAGASDVIFRVSSTDVWKFAGGTGHLLAVTDNTYDIGASGATRPRNLFVAGTGVFGGALSAGPSTDIFWTGRAGMRSSTDGIIVMWNNAGTDFTRLQLGGTTDSFGAVGRDGAGVKIVGAAGGSTAWIKVPAVTVANLPSAATAGDGARAYVTDAVSQVFGATVTGGGAVPSPVYSDGTVWRTG